MCNKKTISAFLCIIMLTSFLMFDVNAQDNIVNYVDGGSVNIVQAEACVLMDAKTGLILYEKNPDERLYPASITKIMTTYLACVNSKSDELVTHSENAIHGVPWDSSLYGMQVGETCTMDAALHAIMMFSANEVCMAVAEHIDGNVQTFMNRVNNQLKQWGCTGTQFTNPHGYHDDNHYTTARDMATITYHAVQNEYFNKIWGCVYYDMPATNKSPAVTVSTHVMNLRKDSMYYDPNAKGAKTGFHDMAWNTLVTYGEKDGNRLIAVIMKDGGVDRAYNDSKKLLDYGFLHYKKTNVYDGKYAAQLDVTQSYDNKDFTIGTLNVSAPNSVDVNLPEFVKGENISVNADIPATIKAPVSVGDKIGKLDITCNGALVATADITAANEVKELSTSEIRIEKYKQAIKEIKFKPLIAVFVILLLLVLAIKVIRVVHRSKKRRKNKRKKKISRYSSYD